MLKHKIQLTLLYILHYLYFQATIATAVHSKKVLENVRIG